MKCFNMTRLLFFLTPRRKKLYISHKNNMREISLEIFTKVDRIVSLLVFGGQKTHANLILHKKKIKEM